MNLSQYARWRAAACHSVPFGEPAAAPAASGHREASCREIVDFIHFARFQDTIAPATQVHDSLVASIRQVGSGFQSALADFAF
jgi:hypothetical protein